MLKSEETIMAFLIAFGIIVAAFAIGLSLNKIETGSYGINPLTGEDIK